MQDGKTVVLHPRPYTAANLALPCGKCIGCKQAKAQEWAARAMHEAREHEHSIFATLTYAPKHLPKGGTLLPRDLTLFLKRLRQAMARTRCHPPALNHGRLRYLASGEYGDIGGRPHYHAILFGVSLSDAIICGHGKNGDPLYASPTLDKLWRYGSVTFGELTMASAAYTASYTIKSIGTQCDPDGVVRDPFIRMSLKPGLGEKYALRYSSDLRSGCLIVDGHPTRIPRYYKKVLERPLVAGPDPEREVRRSRHDILEEASLAIHQRMAERFVRDPRGRSTVGLEAEEKIALRRRELTRSKTL